MHAIVMFDIFLEFFIFRILMLIVVLIVVHVLVFAQLEQSARANF